MPNQVVNQVNMGDKTASGSDIFNYAAYGFHIRISDTEVYSLDKGNCESLITGSGTENDLRYLLSADFQE